MFQKKDVIFSDAIGVCYVEDIVKLAAQKNAVPVAYYVLRSLTDKKKNSYIPVENHKSLLRPLISLEEAQKLLQETWEKEKRGEEADSQDKLLQEALYIVERAQKLLEELKSKDM
ncbi:MAG: CarD family transcriptional regulator [Lachnospiraceae bacterium]|nr:CarD family transcriptional regulator [Lachnospiraceae bacterium]